MLHSPFRKPALTSCCMVSRGPPDLPSGSAAIPVDIYWPWESHCGLAIVIAAAHGNDPISPISLTWLWVRRFGTERRPVCRRQQQTSLAALRSAVAGSADCFPQIDLVRSAPGAAIRELAVDNHARQALNPVLLCPHGDVGLVHVVNLDVVGRTCNAPDQLYGLVTGRATGGENLNLSP